MGKLRTEVGRQLHKARRRMEREEEFNEVIERTVEGLQKQTGCSEKEALRMLEQAGVIERVHESPVHAVAEHIVDCPACRAEEKQRAMDMAGFEVDLANHRENCEACRRWDDGSTDASCDVDDALVKLMNDRLKATLCPEGRAMYGAVLAPA